jgi:hypothetical protein
LGFVENRFADAAALLGAMQRELRAVDVTLPVITAQTMAQVLERSQAAPKVVATCLGIVLALRATPGAADIGIGSMDVYRPNIDPVALVAIADRCGSRRRRRRIRARAPGRPNGSTYGPAPRVMLRYPAWSTTSGLP